jgi:hypothetical protein
MFCYTIYSKEFMALSNLRVSNLKNPKTLLSILLQLSILLVSVSYSFLYPPQAQAKVTTSYVRFDRQSNGATLGGVVCVADDGTAPNGQSQGINKVIVAFPSSFSLVGTGWTADTTATNLPSGVTQWPTVSANPQTVDTATKAAIFVTGDITTSATYCFHFTATGSTVGTGGNDQYAQVWAQKVSGGGLTTPIINFGYATSIISTANGEQIGVTASVSGTMTFSLSGGAGGQTLPLGVLGTTAVTAPYVVQASVSTNAARGYLAWVKSANAALNSAGTSGTIASVTGGSSVSLTGGNNGYGIYAYSSFASTTITPPFDGGVTGLGTAGGIGVGQIHSTQFDQIASYASAVTSGTFNIGTRARVVATQTPATDYADTITVIAAGSF